MGLPKDLKRYTMLGREDVINDLVEIIAEPPCSRCRATTGNKGHEKICDAHDCMRLYREEAERVYTYIIANLHYLVLLRDKREV